MLPVSMVDSYAPTTAPPLQPLFPLRSGQSISCCALREVSLPVFMNNWASIEPVYKRKQISNKLLSDLIVYYDHRVMGISFNMVQTCPTYSYTMYTHSNILFIIWTLFICIARVYRLFIYFSPFHLLTHLGIKHYQIFLLWLHRTGCCKQVYSGHSQHEILSELRPTVYLYNELEENCHVHVQLTT